MGPQTLVSRRNHAEVRNEAARAPLMIQLRAEE